MINAPLSAQRYTNVSVAYLSERKARGDARRNVRLERFSARASDAREKSTEQWGTERPAEGGHLAIRRAHVLRISPRPPARARDVKSQPGRFSII